MKIFRLFAVILILLCSIGCSGSTSPAGVDDQEYTLALAEVNDWYKNGVKVAEEGDGVNEKIKMFENLQAKYFEKHRKLAEQFPQHSIVYEGMLEVLEDSKKQKEREKAIADELKTN